MFLPEFNSTDIQRNTQSVFKAIKKGPIIITRQGDEGAVMMTKKDYSKLVKRSEEL